ncbi:GntR family transcriptional regulator [Sporosarcina sp. ACRSL]|uniref:GntR family transcriptional regulator n=1 Tax=Sporosarcina sp. ACRSL TaxID=2918215 RepID=UPI001EF4CA1A|nr:GntR family transcriptional regulator [Sporosarcina sp. ACRSL]MCG7344008.1 GntR family transcriptional regulator [Sporosarcina sp. ACRSL]
MKIQKMEPLYLQVYSILRKEVLEGVYQPGQKLVESRIAADLGVSRGPVREAMGRLEQEGLVVQKDNYNHVIEYTEKDVIDVYQCRKALESMAVELATKFISKEELTHLKEVLERSEEAFRRNDSKDIIKNNIIFHDIIVISSRNNSLIDMVETLKGKITYYRSTIIGNYHRNDVNDDYIKEHREIFTAISDGNATIAKKLMEKHMDSDISAFVSFMNKSKKNKQNV